MIKVDSVKDDIDRLVKETEKFNVEDKIIKERIEAKNQIEQYFTKLNK